MQAIFGIVRSTMDPKEEIPSYEFPASGRIILAFSEEVRVADVLGLGGGFPGVYPLVN